MSVQRSPAKLAQQILAQTLVTVGSSCIAVESPAQGDTNCMEGQTSSQDYHSRKANHLPSHLFPIALDGIIGATDARETGE